MGYGSARARTLTNFRKAILVSPLYLSQSGARRCFCNDPLVAGPREQLTSFLKSVKMLVTY